MDMREREARRGILGLLVLAVLRRKPMSAQEIVEFLQSKGIRMPIGTIYPLLKRLEKQKLIEGRKRDKKIKEYRLTPSGEETFERLRESITNILQKALEIIWESRGSC